MNTSRHYICFAWKKRIFSHSFIIKFFKSILLLILIYFLLPANIYPQSSIWQKVYKRGGFFADNKGFDVCQLNDGKFLILGNIEYPPGAYILKINEYGNLLDSIFIAEYPGYSCAPTIDNGFITIGDNQNGIFAMKINSSCRVEWIKEYPNTYNANCNKVIRTNDNKFLCCGSISYYYGMIIKIDDNGNLIWQKSYPAGFSKEYKAICETNDGNYLFAGLTVDSELGNVYCSLDKIDTSGTVKFTKIIYNICEQISVNRIDNQYILGVCFYDSSITNKTAGYLRIDSLGNILKTVSLPRYINYKTAHKDCKIVNPNKFLFVNYRYKNNATDTMSAYTMLTDSLGNIISIKLFNSTDYSELLCGYSLSNRDFIFVGNSNHINMQLSNIYVIKTDSLLNAPTVGIVNNSQNIPSDYIILETYPNPFNSQINIKYTINKDGEYSLVIYDLLGKEINAILNVKILRGTYITNYDFSNLPSGIYFLRLFGKTIHTVKKVVFLK